jgi:hypothetical protein
MLEMLLMAKYDKGLRPIRAGMHALVTEQEFYRQAYQRAQNSDNSLRPWESITIDFLGPFNVSNGYQHIMVVMEQFSSAIILVPHRNKFTARDVANTILTQIYSTHRLPASILSDRDARFTSKFWQGLHAEPGINRLMSTSFHQNTKAQVERANQTIGQMLRIFKNNNQNEWAHHLWRVAHAFNNSSTSTMGGRSPHEIMYGHVLRTLPVVSTSNVPAVNKYLEQQEVDNAVAWDALLAARYRQANVATHRKNTRNPFEVGQLAFYKKLTREKGKVKKLTAIWEGPYEITKIDDDTGNCTLKVPKGKRIHPVFAPDRLEPFHGRTSLFPAPQPSKANPKEKLYDVKEILDHKREDGNVYWYVSRAEYEPEDNSWEPDEYIRDVAADAIYEYLSKQAIDSDFRTTEVSLPTYFFYPSPDGPFCSSSSEDRPDSTDSSSDFE